MKILHIVADLPRASGISVFLGEIAAEQVKLGHVVSVRVKCLAEEHYPLDSRIRGVGDEGLFSDADVVHIHGLWNPWLTRMAKWARRTGCKVVWSPHGMLTPWALKNKLVKKVLGLALYQWRGLSAADLIHVTAESEREDVRRLRLKNPVVIAPLGVRCSGGVKKFAGADKVLLFVSRVQRKKGLENLLRAWAKLSEETKRGWRVRIVGPDEDGHIAELTALCGQLGISCSAGEVPRSEVTFVGPKFGEDLSCEYASADLFVLPTHSENFGGVVIEALAHGVPVICTKGAPWQELESHQCGWWVDIGVDPMAGVLTTAFATSQTKLDIMGENGRRLVEDKYDWRAVAQKVLAGYEEVLK